MNVSVIIAAAGSSTRMKSDKNKVLTSIAGRPALGWSLELFQATEEVQEIIIAGAEGDIAEIRDIAMPYSKVRLIIGGGSSRMSSVMLCLGRIGDEIDKIAVHDAARPLLSMRDWQTLIQAAANCSAVILATPIADSIKLVDENVVLKSIPRENALAVQTPQIFDRHLLLKAYRAAVKGEYNATDDAALVERIGGRVSVILSRDPNFKITYSHDLLLADLLLKKRQDNSGGQK